MSDTLQGCDRAAWQARAAALAIEGRAFIDGRYVASASGRVLGYIDLGVAEGARIAFGGRQAFADSGGYYVEATVLDGVRPAMRVAREEIFGPVLTVSVVRDEAQALAEANDTIYGLAAARSGPATPTSPTACRMRSGAARCGSTATIAPRSQPRSAASSSPASAATARRMRSTSTPT